jgi:hypothetical protein
MVLVQKQDKIGRTRCTIGLWNLNQLVGGWRQAENKLPVPVILLYLRLGTAIFNHHEKSPNLAGDRDRTNDN